MIQDTIILGPIRGRFYDSFAMTHCLEPIRLLVEGDDVVIINPGLESIASIRDIDFTKDTVRIGKTDLDSDELRFALEEIGR